MLTSDTLFDYAKKQYEKTGLYPTVRQCAKRFKTSSSLIEEKIEDYQGKNYLGLIVGYKTFGGIAVLEPHEYCVEAY